LLYGKRDLLQEINFPSLVPAPDYAPENAETGTQNQEGMVGAAAAIDFLASLGGHGARRERLTAVFGELHSRNTELFRKLWNGLLSIEGVTLFGPTPDQPRTPTVSMRIANCDSRTAAERLVEKGLFLSHGDFYAWTVVERLGLSDEGLLRVGCACYTTEEEIDRLLEGIKELNT
jgi:selenocysteine lyase/cysteine desulfurase